MTYLPSLERFGFQKHAVKLLFFGNGAFPVPIFDFLVELQCFCSCVKRLKPRMKCLACGWSIWKCRAFPQMLPMKWAAVGGGACAFVHVSLSSLRATCCDATFPCEAIVPCWYRSQNSNQFCIVCFFYVRARSVLFKSLCQRKGMANSFILSIWFVFLVNDNCLWLARSFV